MALLTKSALYRVSWCWWRDITNPYWRHHLLLLLQRVGFVHWWARCLYHFEKSPYSLRAAFNLRIDIHFGTLSSSMTNVRLHLMASQVQPFADVVYCNWLSPFNPSSWRRRSMAIHLPKRIDWVQTLDRRGLWHCSAFCIAPGSSSQYEPCLVARLSYIEVWSLKIVDQCRNSCLRKAHLVEKLLLAQAGVAITRG